MIEYLNILFSEMYKILFLLVPVLVSVAMIVWLDRRIWAFVQKRQGPNVVGPFGLLQSLADALKINDPDLIEFMKACFEWKPEKRLKPIEALQMPWIQKSLSENRAKIK